MINWTDVNKLLYNIDPTKNCIYLAEQKCNFKFIWGSILVFILNDIQFPPGPHELPGGRHYCFSLCESFLISFKYSFQCPRTLSLWQLMKITILFFNVSGSVCMSHSKVIWIVCVWSRLLVSQGWPTKYVSNCHKKIVGIR